MQSLWLIIIVFFLTLLIIPIFTNIHASFDIINNLGAISLFIFFIKIIAYKVRYQNGQIIVFSLHDSKDIPVQLSDKKLRFIEQLGVQIKNKIIVRSVTIYSRIGVRDACNTALLTGVVSALLSSFLGYIKNTKKSAKLKLVNIPDYNGSHMTLSANAKCYITLFDVLYALIMSFLIVKRSEKYERI